MPARKLKQFLDANSIKYISIKHSPAFTAQEVAHTAHIRGKDLAKTVIVKVGSDMAMAVLPAKNLVDLDLLREVTGVEDVELAGEKEFKNLFPDCEIGAMPPFGNLYGMQVFVAEPLTKDKEIAFNAGTHSELIKMAYEDFERLVKPKVVKFSLA
ncbi:MAG TPA: YbaK/EbsC family protein [Ignavibacteriales bacterium]|nr:YbaK/EbsC family protein [Ignavibacteriales bacterium]